jgi:hypothetical protein
MKFTNPQARLIRGVESPMPLGLANGVGNETPHNAETRCGIELQKTTPAKNREKCIWTTCRVRVRYLPIAGAMMRMATKRSICMAITKDTLTLLDAARQHFRNRKLLSTTDRPMSEIYCEACEACEALPNQPADGGMKSWVMVQRRVRTSMFGWSCSPGCWPGGYQLALYI